MPPVLSSRHRVELIWTRAFIAQKDASEMNEPIMSEWFGKDVRDVRFGRTVDQHHLLVLDRLSNEMIPASQVLRSASLTRILSDLDCRLVVLTQLRHHLWEP